VSGTALALTECMPRILRPLALVVALLASAACHHVEALGPDPVIAGQWHGHAKVGLLQVDANFTQNGDSVGGTGSFSSPLGGSDFTVTGTLTGAQVSLVLYSAELGSTTFVGRFTEANRIVGIVARPNADDLDLTLDRG
jgi:hypothetical protein